MESEQVDESTVVYVDADGARRAVRGILHLEQNFVIVIRRGTVVYVNRDRVISIEEPRSTSTFGGLGK